MTLPACASTALQQRGRGWKWGLSLAASGILLYAVYTLIHHDDRSQQKVWTTEGLALPRAPSLFGAGGHEASRLVGTALGANESQPNLQSSSLTGTEVDGSWALDAQDRLQPSLLLRRRFDYFLSLLGEQDVTTLRAMVDSRVRHAHSPASAQSVMALWDRYVQLQQYPWKSQINLDTPAQWNAVSQERYLVRREILGPAWADAFYKEEEDQLREWIAGFTSADQGSRMQRHAAKADTAPLPAQSPLLPDAQQREAQLQVQWAQWDARLQAARVHQQSIQQSPELSALQRQAALDRYMTEHFTPVEKPRAEAMLRADKL